MKIIIYEDEKWSNLTPLSYLKSVFELRCGFSALFEKINSILPDYQKGLWVRDYIKNLIEKKFSLPVNNSSFFEDDLLLVNGRWLATEGEIKEDEEKVVISEQDIVYAIVKKENVDKFFDGNFEEFLKRIKENIKNVEEKRLVINYPWDLMHHNPEAIKKDFEKLNRRGIKGDFSDKASIVGNENDVYIEEGAKIHPFVVLDTSKGPVYIEKEVEIFPFARIEGPCYIGEDTQIMPGANIREGNSFGPVCRVGGEVEESIFHSYSNKYHDGFIGHSYIGEFVNLGGLTTNSDLKNDYSNVTVYLNGKPVDTGLLKVGSFIGDHTKTSIGTLFNTGTVAGIMCNITAGGILPKYFPSFSWFINGKYMKGLGIEKAIETAKIVMGRRDRELSPEEEEVMRKVYEMTTEERREYARKSRKI